MELHVPWQRNSTLFNMQRLTQCLFCSIALLISHLRILPHLCVLGKIRGKFSLTETFKASYLSILYDAILLVFGWYDKLQGWEARISTTTEFPWKWLSTHSFNKTKAKVFKGALLHSSEQAHFLKSRTFSAKRHYQAELLTLTTWLLSYCTAATQCTLGKPWPKHSFQH